MGGDEDDPLARPNELPRHSAKVPAPFFMSETEITVKQFIQFIEGTGHGTNAERRPSDATWRHTPHEQSKADFPVRNVSCLDAQAYCEWLSKTGDGTFRLPTEVEWEFACRAGTKNRYYWFGDEIGELEKHAWIGTSIGDEFPPGTEAWRGIEREQPCSVKAFPSNPYGLFGMHGNVSEWTADQYRRYLDESPEDEHTTKSKIVRGGNYYVGGPVWARCSNRSWMHEKHFSAYVGFRVVWEAEARHD